MSNNSNGSQTSTSQLAKILELNRHVLSLAALCYAVGFVITNLYLGSFGVVNFDILRVRYILAGMLFALFMAIIIGPVYGLVHVLRSQEDSSVAITLSTVFFFTANRYAVILIGVLAIGAFASTRSNPTLEFSRSTKGLDWSHWFSNEFPQLFLQSVEWVLLYLGVAVVLGGHNYCVAPYY